MYNKEKIKKFHEYTLDDYNRSLVVEDIAKVIIVKKTNGSFTQLGMRTLLDDDIFIDPSFHEYLPGAGRRVAIGERDYLIKSILGDKEIEKIKFKEDIKEFPKHIEFNDGYILISTKFYVGIFTKLMHRIDYEEKNPRLDYRYGIISVPEKVLGNKIIIIDKDAILWEKELFDDKETKKKGTLNIIVKPAKEFGKADIMIRSVNRIKYLNPELIKVLEVEE